MTEPTQRFLRACRRLPVDRTPVWFMRQAGRYMSEYREIRSHHTLLEICAQPELAAEVTMQPVRAFDVDAAILFADILLPLIPLGAGLEFIKGEGPVIPRPVREPNDVLSLREFEPREELAHVLEALRLLRRQLPEETSLIGFGGAPYTVASYLIEGASSRNHLHTRTLMLTRPDVWHQLMELLARVLGDYLVAQVEAGAQAIQMFDSWVGELGPDDYCRYVQPYSAQVLRRVAGTGVPVLHFGTGTATLLTHMRAAGGDVIGVDWRIPLDEGWARIGFDRAIQGNLDPLALFAPPEELDRRVVRILDQAGGRPGHIFNLGHGILPTTPAEAVRRVTDRVHQYQPDLATAGGLQ